MSEFTSQYTSENLSGQEPATPVEIAEQYEQWSALEAGFRGGKVNILGARVIAYRDSTVVEFGSPLKPTTTYEFYRNQTVSQDGTGDLTVAVKSWQPNQVRKEHLVRRYDLTEDGSESAHEVFYSRVSWDEDYCEHTESLIVQPFSELSKQGLDSLRAFYADLTAPAPQRSHSLGTTLLQRMLHSKSV